MRPTSVLAALAAIPAAQAFVSPVPCSLAPHTTARSVSSPVRHQGMPALVAAARPRSTPALRMSAGDDFDMSAFFAEVDRRDEVALQEGDSLTGESLRDLVMERWKYPLEVRLHRRRDAFGVMNLWVQIMWKHLWEQSFPMTEEEYNNQLDAVAWYLNEWNVAGYVRNEIKTTTQNPGLTVNGGAKTVMIKLDMLTEEQQQMLAAEQ